MKKYLLALSILSGLVSADSIQNTPLELGYKQIKLGMSSEEISALDGFYFKCTTTFCYENAIAHTLAGANLNGSIMVTFKENKAGSIYLGSNTSNFYQIAKAYTMKYGESAQKIDGVVKNRNGVEFSNKKYIWENEDGIITLQERAGTVDKMSITITSRKYLQSLIKDTQENMKKNVNDL